MKRPALTLPASLRALQPPEVLRAIDAARAPARGRRVAATPVVPSARVEASGAVVLRLDGLRLVSPLNGSHGHWSASAKRRAAERRHVEAAVRLVPSRPLERWDPATWPRPAANPR